MSQSSNGRPQDAASSQAVLVRALGLLNASAGIERSMGDLGDIVRRTRAAHAEDRTFLQWLGSASEDAGLRPAFLQGTCAFAIDQVEPERPLLTCIDDGRQARLLALLETRGRRVRILWVDAGPESQSTWMAKSELHATLGVEPDEVLRWFAAEPAIPCETAGSPSSGSVGGPPAEKLGPLRRLVRLVQPDRGDILTVVVFAIATGVLMLATPIAVQALVNFVAFGGTIPPLVVVALLLLLGLGFAGALIATQTWIVEILQRRIFVRMVADLAARLPRVTSVRGEGYGPELVNRFFDIVTIQKVGSSLLLDGLGVLLSVLVGLVILAFYHPLLLAFDLVLLVIIGLLVLGPARRGIDSAIKESKAKYAVQAWLEEIARNPLMFKSSGARSWAFAQSDRLALDYVEYRRSHYRVVFGQVVGVLALNAVASTALLSIGGFLVIQGSLTLGQLVAAELIVTMVVSSVAKMGKHLESFYDLMAAVDKVGQLLDLPVESLEGEHPPESEGAARLSVSQVQLAPGRAEKFSTVVEPRASLGVTGEPGSGKSRLMEMLWGLYQPASGNIQIDGRDVRDLAPEHLRRISSLVSSPEIAAGSLRENVRMARDFVTDDDVRDALDRLGLLKTFTSLPDGLDTVLASDGFPLSSTEQRALMVARAIAGRPRLLLLDGSLDHLSSFHRERALDTVFDASAPWTLVLTSDRPELLSRCDDLLHLPNAAVDSGPIVSPGV